MSKEIIKEAIFSEQLLLSQPYEIGEFAGRHFYHPIFGFGTVQADRIPALGMSSAATSLALEIAWDKEGTFGRASTSAYYEEDTLEELNQRVLDDERVKEEINHEAFYMIEEGPFASYDRCEQDIKIIEFGNGVDLDALRDPDIDI